MALAAATTAFLAAAAPSIAVAQTREKPSLTEEQKAGLRRIEKTLTFVDFDPTAVPSWLMGDLGPAGGDPGASALDAVGRVADIYRMTEEDGFAVRSVERDEVGDTHVRLQQQHRGRPVVGAELIVHIGRERVTGINGHFVPELRPPAEPRLDSADALALAARKIAPKGVTPLSEPALVIFLGEDARAHLAWTQSVEYVGDEGYDQETLFADSVTGELLGRHALIHTAKDRKVHDGTGICGGSSAALPGPLLVQEGGSLAGIGEAAVDAYNGTGKTYDFYRHAMSRDSYDGAGATLVSSMHMTFGGTCTPNNAAWLSLKKQMGYGDGDGSTFTHLSNDVDVTAHELTHAVTSETANLAYQKESGALNEAFSDIFGEFVDTFQGCAGWKIGEDVYTPGTSGDALRYMNDPTDDGYSADYYPDRLYPGACSANGGNDYCGVHGNSGIANLAFKLLSTGGTHPQGKTAIDVPAVGIDLAGRIFYRALRYYLTSNSNFADARATTVQAAKVVASCSPMSTPLADAVNAAWDAVGVPNDALPLWAIATDTGPAGPLNPCIFQTPWVELMYNRGFEASGLNSFAWARTRSTAITNAGTPSAHAGSWKAQLGGNGEVATETLYQQVSIPEVATQASLSFWLNVASDETTGVLSNDDLTVELRNCKGQVLTTLGSFSNLDEAAGYVSHSFDVAAYKGQVVRVYLKAVENATLKTTFTVDDFSLKVK